MKRLVLKKEIKEKLIDISIYGTICVLAGILGLVMGNMF